MTQSPAQRFSVWAPDRERVSVRVGPGDRPLDAPPARDHPMTRDERGWWHADVPVGPSDAAHPLDYAFLLDDDPEALPDPRSAWQPNGVHGPSRRYDHAAFPWTDTGWSGRALPGSVVYELHIGTFTEEGTFDAAIGRLDHLVDLGADLVEVMPVNAFDGVHGWGYDGVLWGAVHQPYGGPDAFKRFVDACHARGLGVLLDVVYNHLGPSGAYLPRFGPYFSGENAWGPSLNLDGPGSDEVRRHVIDDALGWLRDYHLDGLRLDAVHALADRRATHLLAELSAEVDALAAGLRRPLALIAESDLNDPAMVTAREAGGRGMTAQWCDDLHHALHAALTGEDQGYYADFAVPDALARTLRSAFLHAGTWSSFRGRTHGAPVDTRSIPGSRFLAYLQNHDQVGNRARGDRMPEAVRPGLLACGAAIVLCSPYTPMLFMGEEWAASTPWRFFASFPDPELAEGVRRGRRREFAGHGWGGAEVPDPMDPATRERSVLRWEERDRPGHKEVLELYRSLIALRRARPELADPRLDRFAVGASGDGRVLVLHRGALRVVCNLRAEAAAAVLDRPARSVLLASAGGAGTGAGGVETGAAEVRLPAESFAVLAT
ncbi:maltooligosyltrehalose trehalohydrolase [Spinactinospora alkalitolerans]|uniref:Malto-oligosyltrehalose trehalohydrolase n=1 Tax=Spinactinospora alkalitolerans TaxID=687207 RepID=A0A852TV59_9ACTN|nr:malto-oligosyltrehalose trehalohydrolase [Spinactinospora alkalitolerans]NYE47285.1 maltooligosyltrehalose trehalohydrolase [Spinactinospora alkalitolerans]